MAIKFYRAKALPSSLNSSHDGVWFIKPDGATSFRTYNVKDGVVVRDWFEDLEIGGRNYLPNFHSPEWNIDSGVVVDRYSLHFPANSGNPTAEIILDVESDTNYTFTFNSDYARYAIREYNGGVGDVIVSGSEPKTTFNTGSFTKIILSINTGSNNRDKDRNVSYIKLERGNIATDWTPAPEDQISDWLQTEPTAFDFINNKPTKLSDFINDGYALDSDVVHKTGDENIDDKKRFLEHVRTDKGTVKIGNSLHDYYNPYSGYFSATNHNIFKIKLPLNDIGNANMSSLDLSIYDYTLNGYPANIILSFRKTNSGFSSRDYAVTNSERILTLTLGIENGDLFLIIETTGFNYPRIFINKYSSFDNILYKDIEVTSETSIDYSSFSEVQNVSITYLASKNWVNTQGFLTAETDPTVPSHVKAITTGDINDWNAAYDWVSLGGVLRTSVSLGSSDDLDLVLEPGYYHHAGGSKPLNTPMSGSQAGYLEVVNNGSNNFIRQTWRGRDNIYEYQRTRSSNGTWSAWVQYITDENLDSQAIALGFIKSADLSGYVPTSRTITAGNGLSGGGNLNSNRTITLGTPSAIGLSTTNSVTSTSHTHALDSATITAINQGVTAHGWGDWNDAGLAKESWVSANFDNYGFWNLKTNGVQRKRIHSGNDVDFVAGDNIGISYGADGKVIFDVPDSAGPQDLNTTLLTGNTIDHETSIDIDVDYEFAINRNDGSDYNSYIKFWGPSDDMGIDIRASNHPLSDYDAMLTVRTQGIVARTFGENPGFGVSTFNEPIDLAEFGAVAWLRSDNLHPSTGDKTFQFPNKSGTLALEEDIDDKIDAYFENNPISISENLTYPLVVVVDDSCLTLTNNARYLFTEDASEVCILADPGGSDEGKEILILNDTGGPLTINSTSGTTMRKLQNVASGNLNISAGYKGRFRVINNELVEIG